MVHRSTNSHQEKLKRLPFFARLCREDPMHPADRRELEQAAGRIAGPTGWYAIAGRRKDADCTLLHFATQFEAEEMQRWIDESGIEKRPAPPAYDGPQLSGGRYNQD